MCAVETSEPETTPLVSAVIPTRNRSHLVVRAVRSALEQTYRDLEVITVIDGADQSTVDALAAVADRRLRVIQLPSSVGGAEARNVGITAASGFWIALLDDDDEWLPRKIERQLETAQAAQNPYMVVFSKMIAKLPNIEYVWPRRLPGEGEAMSEYLFCRKSISFGEGFLQTSSFFASKQMFSEVPFRRDQQRFQDTDWLLRACAHPGSKFTVLPEPLVAYYMDGHRETISGKSDWAYLYNWGVQNRNLFTARAFAFFIATQCVPRAAKQGEPSRVFLRLLRECSKAGVSSAHCILLCFVFWFIPESVRRRMRDSLATRGEEITSTEAC